MPDLISRQAAIDAIKKWGLIDGLSEGQAIEILADEEKLPTIQPKTGKWEERAIENVKAAGIEEVQVARCSACGLYLTTPYIYYFSNYKYCPHCGARMVNEDEID